MIDDNELVGPFTRKALRNKLLEAYTYGTNPWATGPANSSWVDADIDALASEAPKQLQGDELRATRLGCENCGYVSDIPRGEPPDETNPPVDPDADEPRCPHGTVIYKNECPRCEKIRRERLSTIIHEQNVKPLDSATIERLSADWPED